jgi:hypothetical protein
MRKYFLCSCGTGMDSTKIVLAHLVLDLCFAYGGICGSLSAFRCVRGVKRLSTIFMLGWDR